MSDLPVLMYHSVPDGPAADAAQAKLMVPLALVRRQWRALLDDGWALFGLTEALAARERGADQIVAVTFDDGYADFLGVVGLLAELDVHATLYLPTAHIGTDDSMVPAAGRLLRWPEVAALPATHVEIGSHARRHRPLDVLPTDDVADEVAGSRRELTERLGREPTSFCYPNGYASRRCRDAVLDAGYANACIVGRRLAPALGDPYRIPRLQVLPSHDESGIRQLVRQGEGGLAPKLKQLARPAWRGVRWATYRSTGRMLT